MALSCGSSGHDCQHGNVGEGVWGLFGPICFGYRDWNFNPFGAGKFLHETYRKLEIDASGWECQSVFQRRVSALDI